MRPAGRARRLASLVVLPAVLLTAPAAAASPTTAYGGPSPVCTVTDPLLEQLSGLAVRGEVLYAVTDQRPELYALDGTCAVDVTTGLPSGVDVEALHATADGFLWVGDLGGNRAPREEVAVLRVNPASGNVVRLALAYPDGPHDAETLLVTPSNDLLVVTKESSGLSGLYAAPPAVDPQAVTPLVRVGEVDVRSWPGRTRGNGSTLVTDGAVSPDGTHVVLRTYLDAFEWDAPDGDVVRAMTTQEPRAVRLPEAPQGEAVAYGADGLQLLVGGEQLPSVVHAIGVRRPAAVVMPVSTSRLADPAVALVAAATTAAAVVAVVASAARSALVRRRSRRTTAVAPAS